MQCLQEPPQEVRPIVAGFVFHQSDDFGRLVPNHGEELAEVGTGDAVEVADNVDGEGLADASVKHARAEVLEAVGDRGVELEGNAEGVG